MLHRNFRRNTDLRRATAQQFCQPCRRHRTRDANLALTPHFRAGYRGVHLVQHANCPRRQQITGDRVGIDRTTEFVVIGQHRGNNAARAVGRRGDHSPARRVLFTHGQGEHVNPVDDVHRIAGEIIAGDQQTP
ncbi:Uncharacterised protein [Salmonella enterica subsp. enterica serovar Bovismorbificans]|nr:Uncharacterised protein [Salmonella enterica subsp. enterica serovar Bovismorbificans]